MWSVIVTTPDHLVSAVHRIMHACADINIATDCTACALVSTPHRLVLAVRCAMHACAKINIVSVKFD